jgi:hypothetical protein
VERAGAAQQAAAQSKFSALQHLHLGVVRMEAGPPTTTLNCDETDAQSKTTSNSLTVF